jgi:NAD(P)-dependent dehydrogenase (short-subunit alcohol dehydrogenase family)
MSPALKNKVAIITGGGRGIGKALALRFAAEGAKIFIPDISFARADSAAKEIKAQGGDAMALEVDISQESNTQEIARKVQQQYGRADILINNAAVWFGLNARPWDTWAVEDWVRILNVNVIGTWLCCKAIAPLMVKQGSGKIINIASDVIKVTDSQFFLPYALSKSAVYTMTQSLAAALGPSGINVNSIGPGYTVTEATLGQEGSEQIFTGVVNAQSIKRRQMPADIEGVAVFLASKESDFITGQYIVVDGGHVMV